MNDTFSARCMLRVHLLYSGIARHGLSAARHRLIVMAGGFMLLLGGCSTWSTQPGASIVATPFKTCPDPRIDVPQSPGDVKATESATRLSDTLVWARSESIFLGLPGSALIAPANFEQSRRLLQISSRGPLSSSDQSVEAVLMHAIPWLDASSAEDMSALLDSSDAKDAISQGLSIIDVMTSRADNRSKLLPQSTQRASQETTGKADATSDAGEVEVASVGDQERKSLIGDFQKMAAFRAFHLITLLAAGRIIQDLSASTDPRALKVDVRLFNVARFLSTYFDAYFRGGQFVQVSVDQSGTADLLTKNISARIGEKLKGVVSDDQIKKIVSAELGTVCGKGGSGSCDSLAYGSTSFVTRAGFSVQFAGIGVGIGGGKTLVPQASYPKASEFGPQMIRVLVEAIFDANGPHPKSVHGSTACMTGLFSGDECMPANAPADDLTTRIDMFAAGAEALSSAGVGAAIRGGSFSALNNEAVADILETFAGVTSRKLVERVLQAQADSCGGKLYPLAIRVKDPLRGL